MHLILVPTFQLENIVNVHFFILSNSLLHAYCIMLWHAVLLCVIWCVTLCYAMLCCVMRCYAVLCDVLCCNMLCYFVQCCVMPCYVVLCDVILCKWNCVRNLQSNTCFDSVDGYLFIYLFINTTIKYSKSQLMLQQQTTFVTSGCLLVQTKTG